MIPIQTGPARTAPPGFPLARDGFRPFFLGATASAAASMIAWLLVYAYGAPTPRPEISGAIWHAHEMVFGFASAVIAGFLLTAVRNWTGRVTLVGQPLLALALVWLVARLTFYVPAVPLWIPAVTDIGFALGLSFSIARPIISAGQLRAQGGILSMAVSVALANALFFAGAAGWIEAGVQWGLFLGFYSVLGLVLTIGRRILPNFIAHGVGYPVNLRNDRRVDRAATMLLLVFVVADVFLEWTAAAAILAALLSVVHGIRLQGWHSRGLWTKPLLWMPYLSYAAIVFGFGLVAVEALVPLLPFVGIHALAVGGVGFIAQGMMARVSLGHSGRNIAHLPTGTTVAFAMLVAAALVRIVLPLVAARYYAIWIMASQALWIGSFLLFLGCYLVIWVRAAVR